MNWIQYWGKEKFDFPFWEKSIQFYCENIRKQFPKEKHLTILDFGAGPGYTGPHLNSHSKMIFIEPSKELLAQCKKRNQSFDSTFFYENLDSAEKDGVLTPNSCDIILINSVLQYIPESESTELFIHLKKLLAPNGKIIASDLIPKKHSLFSDLISVAKFYSKWFSLLRFIQYFFAEVSRLKMRKGMNLQTYTKKNFEETATNNFVFEWIENPTVCSSRLCCILKKNEPQK